MFTEINGTESKKMGRKVSLPTSRTKLTREGHTNTDPVLTVSTEKTCYWRDGT